MPSALIKAHRSELRLLTSLAISDLSGMWREFNTADAEAARDGLLEVLPRLVTVYGSAASTLGADWYEDVRREAGAPGRFRAIAAELPNVERSAVLARWAVEPLFAAEPDHALALSKASGGLQRIVADADRQSVMGSSIADPAAKGWQRVTSGGCDFCTMLAGRGHVYTEASADFQSHDHCHCVAVPAFAG